MKTIDLDTAASEIQQASEGVGNGGPLPYCFLVGAGISNPPVKLAWEIEDDCKAVAQKYKRTGTPPSNQPIDTYSHWFETAYPHPIDRQKYLRALIEGKPISSANFRLAHLLLHAKIGNVVITTNFDDYLSRALTLFGKPHIVCDHPQTVDRIDPTEPDIQIVHVHGSHWFYDCCNLRSEISTRAQPSVQSTLSMLALLDHVFRERMPLVIGYGGWDGDVVMTALQRRLSYGIKRRLYWFCYRQDVIDSLPDWLKSNNNVSFVIPPKIPGLSVDATSQGPADTLSGATQVDAATGVPSVKTKAPKKVEETTLPAQQVLDKLIQTFDLKSPMLTTDPLGYFAEYLRSSLPQEEAGVLYSSKSVIDRVEKAKIRDDAARRVLRRTESQFEQMQDALRRSQYREAIVQGSEMRWKNLSGPQLREFGEAVWSAATQLSDNSDEEIKGYDLVLRISDALLKDTTQTENAIVEKLHERAATALLYKGITLGNLNDRQQEVATYDKVIERFGASTDVEVLLVVGQALINKGLAYGELNRSDDELAAYDQILERFSGLEEPDFRELEMNALFNKEIVLSTLSKWEDAIRACDEVITQFGDDEDLTMRETVAQSFNNKGVYLANLDKQSDAISSYDEVVKRFGESTETTLRKQVALAMVNKGYTLAAINRNDEAVSAYDEVVRRFGDSPELPVQEQVATALYNKAESISNSGRFDEAAIAYNELLTRFGNSTEPGLRDTVRRALNRLGFDQLCKAKQLWSTGREEDARELLLKAQENIDASLSYDLEYAVALGNKGYLNFLLGNEEEARRLLERAISLGGSEIQKTKLENSQFYPVPEDERFRELVLSIPISEPPSNPAVENPSSD